MKGTFCQTLAMLRQERKLNQREAAAALGVSQALLSHYENGVREPGLPFVCRACDFYQVSADFLLGRSSERLPGEGAKASASTEVDAYLNLLRQVAGEEARTEGLHDLELFLGWRLAQFADRPAPLQAGLRAAHALSELRLLALLEGKEGPEHLPEPLARLARETRQQAKRL